MPEGQVPRGPGRTWNGEMVLKRLEVDAAALAAFCRKWRVAEMALFGSALREEFGPESDVDVLVTFEPDPGWDLWDFTRFQGDLQKLLRRKTDVVERSALRNPFFRSEVMRTREVIYAARSA